MPETPKPHEIINNARRFADIAEDQLSVAEKLISGEPTGAHGTSGGRGLALVGIGSALCSIAMTLGRLADVAEHPLVEVRLQGEPPDHDWGADDRCTRCKHIRYKEAPCEIPPDPASVEARIARWRAVPSGMEDETYVDLLCDAEEALADLRERLARHEGVAVEIAIAVVCIDCQRAHEHPAGYCEATNCDVCGGDRKMNRCASCGGELVL